MWQCGTSKCNSSRTFDAGVARAPEPDSAVDLAECTAAAVAGNAVAHHFAARAGVEIFVSGVTDSPKVA
jgi:hypothetical protein